MVEASFLFIVLRGIATFSLIEGGGKTLEVVVPDATSPIAPDAVSVSAPPTPSPGCSIS